MLDLLIKNARVIDGTNVPSFQGDVAVGHGRIVQVGDGIDHSAARVIDADGRIVCPGFIDMHSHGDVVLREYPGTDSMIRQGVTTIVTGNCGISPFPAPANGQGSRSGWTDLRAFVAEFSTAPLGANVAPLIGHGSIRSWSMADPAAAPSPPEMVAMVDATQAAMVQGAHGISTGLIYDPGRFSDTAELIELARIVARHGGFYASHVRGEADTLVEAVDEAIAIGRAAGVPVHLSHHKAKRRRNWGSVATTLAKVDDAIDSGVDVTLDFYPYVASSTTLWAFLPPWATQDKFLAHGDRLPASLHEEVIEALERMYLGSSLAPGAITDLSDLTISRIARSGAHSRYEGVRLDDAVRAAQSSQAEFVIDLLMKGKEVEIIDHAMSEDDMHAVVAHPRCMVGSDAIHFHHTAPGHPHPRNFGTFPRFISRVAPGRMSIESAIHKCTGLPSRRLGLMGERGVLRPGAAADLLMFDPSRFSDNATFSDPKQYSMGLDLAVINGVVAVGEDTETGGRTGRFLLRNTGTR